LFFAPGAGFAHLFAAFGPPLVLKTDNGSHYPADWIDTV
jgi:hypothetical protein